MLRLIVRVALPLSILLSGCSDFSLFGRGKDPGAGDHPPGDSSPAACEGFEAPPARDETAALTCPPDGDGGGSGDPWSAPIWWQASSIPTDPDATQSAVTPIAAQLDDDDALEVITVVTHGFGNADVGWVAAFDGAAGAFEWAWYGAFPTAALLAADVDGDGRNEVLVEESGGHLVALGGDGAELWMSAATEPVETWSGPLNVGDLDEDGRVDVLYGRWVLDGATGATKVEGDPALDNNGAQV